jgi:hypothetical protein
MTTFALNVVTAVPSDSTGGSVWDVFSPLSKLITIACVNNKAQFEKKDGAAVVRFDCPILFFFQVDFLRVTFCCVKLFSHTSVIALADLGSCLLRST